MESLADTLVQLGQVHGLDEMGDVAGFVCSSRVLLLAPPGKREACGNDKQQSLSTPAPS